MEQMTMNMPLLGDDFPQLAVSTTHGPMKLPCDLKGSWFVLFSHPADFTPVCTTEFVAFQKLMPEFEKLGVKLIGLSIDQIQSHLKWIEWIKEKLGVEITFPVIAANDSIANQIGRNMEEIVRAVKALQTSDKNKVALPADWPNNGLIKDRAIIPPPPTEAEAKKRLKEYDGYDFWFCHKSL